MEILHMSAKKINKDLHRQFRLAKDTSMRAPAPSSPDDDAPPNGDDDPKKANENERKERRALEELRKGHIDHPEKS
jgi:hypothetical protein